MRYIILAAGRGTRLSPLTDSIPKSLFKLDSNTTILERTIDQIKHHDPKSEIVVVGGYMYPLIEAAVRDNAMIIHNPFYAITNSIASLWFANSRLNNITPTIIINADVVLEENCISEVLCAPIQRDEVLIDSSIKTDGDYNAQVANGRILVMSKDLKEYEGEYAGVTRLTKSGVQMLNKEIQRMINEGFYDQWYENALVQMIFSCDYELYYKDICEYKWTEVDSVNDLLNARAFSHTTFKGAN